MILAANLKCQKCNRTITDDVGATICLFICDRISGCLEFTCVFCNDGVEPGSEKAVLTYGAHFGNYPNQPRDIKLYGEC